MLSPEQPSAGDDMTLAFYLKSITPKLEWSKLELLVQFESELNHMLVGNN